MRHTVFCTTTRFALIHPAALLGRQGRRTSTQHRLASVRGRARINSHGASVGATHVDGCTRLPGTWSNTPIRDSRPTFQATLFVGPATGARSRALVHAVRLAAVFLAAASATGDTTADATTAPTKSNIRRPGHIAGPHLSPPPVGCPLPPFACVRAPLVTALAQK